MTLTFVARNPYTRQIGVVIASGSDDCVGGSLYFKDHVGLVSVQARGSADTGARALELLAAGHGSADILNELRRSDSAFELRQVIIAPFDGAIAACTGKECIAWAGDISDEHSAAAGNMLTSPHALAAMEKAYRADMQARFPHRLFAALQAGIATGGDVRGHRSCGMVILGGRDAMEARITASADPLAVLWSAIV